MRGERESQVTMLTVVQPDHRIRADHPIRRIKALADAELRRLSPVLGGLYAAVGRPSSPPERLLKACLLIALSSVRSERQFCEQLDYDLLYRWFLDMKLDEPSFDASTCAKNKQRLLAAEVARHFFEGVVRQAKGPGLLSAAHFTVDGTLIEAWASLTSVRPREEPRRRPPDDPGNPTVNVHGEKRTNAAQASTTDPAAQLARKGDGKEAKRCFSAHVVTENRAGLCVDVRVADANPASERTAAVAMAAPAPAAGLSAGDRRCRQGVGHNDLHRPRAPARDHAARRAADHRASGREDRRAYDATHGLRGEPARPQARGRDPWRWMKTVGGLRQTRYRGIARTGLWAYLVASAYDLLRLARRRPTPA